MQGPNAVLNTMTLPPGATDTEARLVLDGIRGAIFLYENGGPVGALIGSWAMSAGTDPYGNTYPQGFDISLGVITGTEFTTTGTGPAMVSYSSPTFTNKVVSAIIPFQPANPNVFVPDGHGNNLPQGFSQFYFDVALAQPQVALTMVEGRLLTYTAATQAGPWTVVNEVSFDDASNRVFVGTPLLHIPIDATITDTNGFTTGNVTSPTLITRQYPTDSVNGQLAGTTYSLKTWFNGTWGNQLMFIYADINGTFTQLCTIGAALGASGDSVDGWLELEAMTPGNNTIRLSLSGAIHDTTGNILPTNVASVATTAFTGTAFAPGDTIGLAIAFGASVAGQNITTEGSRFTRRG